MISIIASSAPGLSPLARGTLYTRILCAVDRRFIPAGAGNTCGTLRLVLNHSVYPRWRGEHHKPPIFPITAAGLSPLARGTRSPAPTSVPARRFIPAGAGNTCVYLSREYIRAVYPRWRGEHQPASADLCATSGLSPLARGTHIEIVFGIYSEAVYPRWRGEHTDHLLVASPEVGLSPLARGTH